MERESGVACLETAQVLLELLQGGTGGCNTGIGKSEGDDGPAKVGSQESLGYFPGNEGGCLFESRGGQRLDALGKEIENGKRRAEGGIRLDEGFQFIEEFQHPGVTKGSRLIPGHDNGDLHDAAEFLVRPVHGTGDLGVRGQGFGPDNIGLQLGSTPDQDRSETQRKEGQGKGKGGDPAAVASPKRCTLSVSAMMREANPMVVVREVSMQAMPRLATALREASGAL